MISWVNYFYFFMLGASMLLILMGLWFTRIMPGIDRWNKRFFRCYFFALLVGTLFGLIEMISYYVPAPLGFVIFVMFMETLAHSMPILMVTVYLLHACGEDLRGSRLLHAVLIMWILFLALAVCCVFNESFCTYTPGGQYSRGPLYPLVPLPTIAMLLLDLAGIMRRRCQLSRKTFISLLVAILPMTVTLLVQLFIDVFPLINICIVISALSMFSLVLSEQIEQALNQQREVAEQQRELARQQREIASQRASIMVLQMRPHFIYNTLMSIYSLCNLDPKKARQVTMDFTDYLRKNFNAVASEHTIPFSAELEHTRAYLAVEQAQYEDLLLVEYDTQFTQFHLPPLTLQPIAENAVKHCMNPDADPLHITIRTYCTDSDIVIIVTDNGPGFEMAADPESHTALANIRKRLKWMSDGKLEITPRDGGGTVVTITIPVNKA